MARYDKHNWRNQVTIARAKKEAKKRKGARIRIPFKKVIYLDTNTPCVLIADEMKGRPGFYALGLFHLNGTRISTIESISYEFCEKQLIQHLKNSKLIEYDICWKRGAHGTA